MASGTRHKRNHEINLVWNYLRRERNHQADWCRKFIEENYFVSVDTLYKIFQEDFQDTEFCEDRASVIYHIVMTNQYQDYTKHQKA